jgi:hypothetical protein
METRRPSSTIRFKTKKGDANLGCSTAISARSRPVANHLLYLVGPSAGLNHVVARHLLPAGPALHSDALEMTVGLDRSLLSRWAPSLSAVHDDRSVWVTVCHSEIDARTRPLGPMAW